MENGPIPIGISQLVTHGRSGNPVTFPTWLNWSPASKRMRSFVAGITPTSPFEVPPPSRPRVEQRPTLSYSSWGQDLLRHRDPLGPRHINPRPAGGGGGEGGRICPFRIFAITPKPLQLSITNLRYLILHQFDIDYASFNEILLQILYTFNSETLLWVDAQSQRSGYMKHDLKPFYLSFTSCFTMGKFPNSKTTYINVSFELTSTIKFTGLSSICHKVNQYAI